MRRAASPRDGSDDRHRPAVGRTRFSADVGVTSFELDLFGRVASLTRAEQNRYFATEAAARATGSRWSATSPTPG
jgi:outer membrane protein TolC